jgi:Tol biopolymer transport system component
MERLSHYELVEQLGEGGMGIVYKARDVRLGRFVALKVLAPGKASDPERRARFIKEARAASALDHPNVLTVHEIGCEDGVDFIVTEYLPGKTLAQLIPRRGIPPREALRWAVSIVDALAATHAAGVIHRDLKPANVMVTDSGLVKILDFGLAKLVDPAPVTGREETQTILTKEGVVLGTCAYMSPEQAEGREVDPRSDVFSFGAVLYEMVTGTKAFARESPSATIAAVLRDDPKPACEISGNVPPELDRVIHRCLRKDPAKRFQSMANLKVALEVLREESATGGARRVRPRRRRLALGVAAAVLLVAAAAGAWVVLREGPDLREPSKPVPLTSFSGAIGVPSLSPDGNHVAFSWRGEADDNTDIYLKLVGPGDPVRLTTDPAAEGMPAFSPDGREIAFVRYVAPGRNRLVVIPALGGFERVVADVRQVRSAPAWSLDGRHLVISERGSWSEGSRLYRVSVSSGEMGPITDPPEKYRSGDIDPTLSPDGRTLAFGRHTTATHGEVWRLPVTEDLLPAGEPSALATMARDVRGPAWMPDGRRLVLTVDWAWSGTASGLGVVSVPAGGPVRRLLGTEGGLAPASSRRGNLVFLRVLRDENVWRLPLEGGRPGRPAPLVASTRKDTDPHLSPDGKMVAFTSDRSGGNQAWLCDTSGGRARQLTSLEAGNTSGARLSPDGRRVVFLSDASGNMDLYLTTPYGKEPVRLTPSPRHETAPSWSRDGAWIYFGSNREDDMQVWKMRPEPGAPALRVTRDGGYAALESADGKALFYSRAGPEWTLRKVPTEGGEETEVLPHIVNWGAFDVTATAIYYVTVADRKGQLRRLRLADGNDELLLVLEKPYTFGVAAASDDSAVLWGQLDHHSSELMLIEKLE